MATDALRAQIAGKWQSAFSRLNRGEPGISGLLSFSEVCSYALQAVMYVDILSVGMGHRSGIPAPAGSDRPDVQERPW